MIGAIIWIILSFLLASWGGKKEIGFVATLFLSLLLSPIIGLIGVAVSRDKKEPPKPRVYYSCKFCGLNSNENSTFCPACEKDGEGLTKEDYKARAAANNPG